MTRRHFFGRTGLEPGTAALAEPAGRERAEPGRSCRRRRSHNPATGGLPGLPHFAPKAKRAIYLFMNGGPSQMDLFDYKPRMGAMFDKDLPDSIRMGQRLTTMTSGQARFPIAPSKYKFAQHGGSGMWVSELLPWTAKLVDRDRPGQDGLDRGDQPRPGGHLYLHGEPASRAGRAWARGSSYGLGTMNQNLPAFVVMTADLVEQGGRPGDLQPALGLGLPAHQAPGRGAALDGRPGAVPVEPRRASTPRRAGVRSTPSCGSTSSEYQQIADPETQTRIAQYEMAFRMQTSVPELTDISNEPKHVLDLYGPDVHTPGHVRRCCLLARRLAERDVRFVQIFHRGWDQHGNLAGDLPLQCHDVDQATLCPGHRPEAARAARRHAGHLGRRVRPHGLLPGQAHARRTTAATTIPSAFRSGWPAAASSRDVVYGETDDFSYNVVANPVHIHDLNATILHCLGIDHRRLTFKFQGLDVRLTGVEEHHPVKGILA